MKIHSFNGNGKMHVYKEPRLVTIKGMSEFDAKEKYLMALEIISYFVN